MEKVNKFEVTGKIAAIKPFLYATNEPTNMFIVGFIPDFDDVEEVEFFLTKSVIQKNDLRIGDRVKFTGELSLDAISMYPEIINVEREEGPSCDVPLEFIRLMKE